MPLPPQPAAPQALPQAQDRSPVVPPEMLAQILAGQQAQSQLTPLQEQMTRVNELRGYREPQGYQAAGMYQAASPLAHIGRLLSGYANEKEYSSLNDQADALRGAVATGQGAATQAKYAQDEATLDLRAMKAALDAERIASLNQKTQADIAKGDQAKGVPAAYFNPNTGQTVHLRQAGNVMVDGEGNPFPLTGDWMKWTDYRGAQKDNFDKEYKTGAFDLKKWEAEQKANRQTGKPVMYESKSGETKWLRQTPSGMVDVSTGEPVALTGDWEVARDKNLPNILDGYGKNLHRPITQTRKAYLDLYELNQTAKALTPEDIKALNKPGLNNIVKTLTPASFEVYMEQQHLDLSPRAKMYLATVNRVGAGIRHKLYGSAVTVNEGAFFDGFSPTAVGVDFNTRVMRADGLLDEIVNDAKAYSTDPESSILRDLPAYEKTDFVAADSGKPKGRTVEDFLNMSTDQLLQVADEDLARLPAEALDKVLQKMSGGQ